MHRSASLDRHNTTIIVIATFALTIASANVVRAETPKGLRLILPPVVTAMTGLESNIYFDNVVLTNRLSNLAVDVVCAKGKQQADRWTWTPGDNEIGDHPLAIELRNDDNELLARSETIIRVVKCKAAPASKEVSVLAIGDSLTHASVYTQRLLDLGSKFETPVKLIGSHAPRADAEANRHEGYGGWTAKRFATHFSETARTGDYKLRGSPFLYRSDDGGQRLDFARYCREVNGGEFPQFATIFLGPNDTFSFNDDTIQAGIDDMLANYDKLIEMIVTASPHTKIGVMLPVPPAASQDAFGSNYGAGQTRWQYKRNQHRLVECMSSRYGGRQSERIHVIATHLNLDCVHGYPSESVAAIGNVLAKDNSAAKLTRQNNGVHPSADGYQQIGDTVFTWIMSQMGETKP